MIIRQFLIEAVLLTMTGGFLGILFGVAFPCIIEYFSAMHTSFNDECCAVLYDINCDWTG